MTKLKWWMRSVGVFYLFLFIAAAFLKLPIQVEGPPGLLEQAAIGEPTANFVVDTWVVLGLILGALGASLIYFSGKSAQAGILIVTIIINELVWGIGSDIYKLFRGYEPVEPLVWIVIHSVIIISGLLLLRKAQTAV